MLRLHAAGPQARSPVKMNVGGLVGWSDSLILDSTAAVGVSGTERVGGLVGNQFDGWIIRSYATGERVRRPRGRRVGRVLQRSHPGQLRHGEPCPAKGSAERAWTDCEFGGVGGLAGNACSLIHGQLRHRNRVRQRGGGRTGGRRLRRRPRFAGATGTSSRRAYASASVRTTVNNNGVIDGTESQMVGLAGQTTAALQSPTDYEGIYENWNWDFDLDGELDDAWHLGTSSQYPVLAVGPE